MHPVWRHDAEPPRVVDSFVIVLCFTLCWSSSCIFKSYARVVPHPSAYCCLECCSTYSVLLDCQLKLPFSFQSLTWSEDQRLIQIYKNFIQTRQSVGILLGDCLWAQARHHMVTFSTWVTRPSTSPARIVWAINRVTKETQPKSKNRSQEQN